MDLFYLGKNCFLIHHPNALGNASIKDAEQSESCELHIYCEADFIPRRVQDFYKKQTRQMALPLVDKYSRQIGAKYSDVIFRDTKRQWGSARNSGKLSFSWRLSMLPMEILEYVIAHEVAHLQQMNHSQAFWDLCNSICPEAKSKHKWLLENGYKFLRINFDRLKLIQA